MKVALVNFVPSAKGKNYFAFNHGLAYLSSSIKQDGHTTALFSISKDNLEAEASLQNFSPHAIFVYLATNQYPLFLNHLTQVWHKLSIPVFVGGPHPTCCPEDVVSLPGVAGACIGEGEHSARMLLERVENGDTFDGIPNIWFKRDGEIVRNEIGYLIPDLDELPFPDREIFPYPRLLKTRAMDILGFEFFFSRGCKYQCSYCINPHLNKNKPRGARLRMRSVESVVKEIEEVTKRYDYRGVVGFQDDIFTLNISWLEEFAAIYRSRVGLPFWCNSHINNLNERIVRTLRHAGCFRVQIGIECGDESTRRHLLGKSISNARILDVTALLRKHHIKIVTYFMVGLPDETEDQIIQSINLCRDISPDWILVSSFCPYPGTSIYDTLVKQGRLDPHFYREMSSDTYYSPSSNHSAGGLSPERREYYYQNFVRLASA